MNTLKHLNQAMRYIEDHLAGDIDFATVAQLACCSEYHFRRLFSTLSGLSVSDYIRRRRLSAAALELRERDVKVIDLAVKYGYTSADAFTRAFQMLHGLTPTEARFEGAALKAIPPIRFQLTIQGGFEMEYRIVEKGAFFIIGLRKRITLIYEGVNPQILAMWESLTEDDIRSLDALSDVEPQGLLNVVTNPAEGREEGTQLDNFVGVATTAAEFEHWAVLPVPAATWAVFRASGAFPQVLQDTWARIYTEWFPMSGYEVINGPEMVWTESSDMPMTDSSHEIWIPVMKKAEAQS